MDGLKLLENTSYTASTNGRVAASAASPKQRADSQVLQRPQGINDCGCLEDESHLLRRLIPQDIRWEIDVHLANYPKEVAHKELLSIACHYLHAKPITPNATVKLTHLDYAESYFKYLKTVSKDPDILEVLDTYLAETASEVRFWKRIQFCQDSKLPDIKAQLKRSDLLAQSALEHQKQFPTGNLYKLFIEYVCSIAPHYRWSDRVQIINKAYDFCQNYSVLLYKNPKNIWQGAFIHEDINITLYLMDERKQALRHVNLIYNEWILNNFRFTL